MIVKISWNETIRAMQFDYLAGTLLFASLVASIAAIRAEAQELIDLTGVPLCTECQLEPRLIVQLGEESGDGIIESEAVHVIHSDDLGMFGVFELVGSRILLFDSTGTFIRSVGRAGGGPAEISGLHDVQFAGSHLVAVDGDGASKLLVMDLYGNHIADTRIPLQGPRMSFRVVSDSSLVVGTMDRSPSSVGYPLHTVLLQTGEPVSHFGTTDDQFSVARPYAHDVLVGLSPGRPTVWRGETGRLHLEEWSVDDERLERTVIGDLAWFPEERNEYKPDDPPPTGLLGFGIDPEDRLWLAANVADPDWEEVSRHGNEGAVSLQDLDGFFDTRVDVFDLTERRHLGSIILDGAFAGFVQLGSAVALQRVIYDDRLVPRVGLFRLDVTSQSNQRRE